MKKKISLPLVIAIALVAAAVAFSAAYLIATVNMNARLTDLSEKQAQFSVLSDVDSYVREKYQGDVDEDKLLEELCRGYAEAFDGEVLYFTAEEYKDSKYTADNGYTVIVLADKSAVVVLTPEQMGELPTDATDATDETSETE